MLAPKPADRTAVVLVRAATCHGLRRSGRLVRGDAPAGWERLEVGFAEVDRLADEVLGYGADVVAVEPPQLRAAVMGRLEEILEVSA
jgi:predicted DNA-binding transcriptional regulator YafY